MNNMYNIKANITEDDTKDKVIFWDVDGTLAPYRYNGHVGDPNGTNNGQSIEEVNNGIFLEREPSKFMLEVLKTSNAKEHIIMGHCGSEKEISDKHKWLDIYFPFIKHRLFIDEDKSKADEIIRYCKENSVDLCDVLFVDDTILILREAEKAGIESWHISSFLDWFIV